MQPLCFGSFQRFPSGIHPGQQQNASKLLCCSCKSQLQQGTHLPRTGSATATASLLLSLDFPSLFPPPRPQDVWCQQLNLSNKCNSPGIPDGLACKLQATWQVCQGSDKRQSFQLSILNTRQIKVPPWQYEEKTKRALRLF